MKPKDLKPPFEWGNQFTTIQDRIFYTFEQYGNEPEFAFPGWDHPDIFGTDKPVKIEFCSGNGDWVAHRASLEPEVHWVSVEKLFARVRKIWAKLKNHRLNNLFCICGEALNSTKRYLPSESVNEVYVNFPDPWPKKKHAKYRLIQMPFVNEIHRILHCGGTVTLVTDDDIYSEQMIEVLGQHPGLISKYPEPYFLTHHEDYGTSYFEDLWREKGKTIRYHCYEKVASCN
jgi:tRNA (guanine-N7-)-methyltransferase